MSIRLVRASEIYGRAGSRIPVSKSTFHQNYVLHDESDPFVPGTTIPRLRPVQLGIQAQAFVDDEIDALAAALIARRDEQKQRNVD